MNDAFATIDTDALTTIHGGDAASDTLHEVGNELSQGGRDISDRLHQGSDAFMAGDYLGALGHDLAATYDVADTAVRVVASLWPGA